MVCSDSARVMVSVKSTSRICDVKFSNNSEVRRLLSSMTPSRLVTLPTRALIWERIARFAAYEHYLVSSTKARFSNSMAALIRVL